MPSELFFLIDENLPFDLIEFFRKRNYRVEHIKKIGKSGIKNGQIYLYAAHNSQWIITRDSDFQSYYKFKKYNISGVIVIKVTSTIKKHILKVIADFFDKYCNRLSNKQLIVIEDNRISIRQ